MLRQQAVSEASEPGCGPPKGVSTGWLCGWRWQDSKQDPRRLGGVSSDPQKEERGSSPLLRMPGPSHGGHCRGGCWCEGAPLSPRPWSRGSLCSLPRRGIGRIPGLLSAPEVHLVLENPATGSPPSLSVFSEQSLGAPVVRVLSPF